jgi:uncharacterized repeat protein (TIGR01451 family)
LIFEQQTWHRFAQQTGWVSGDCFLPKFTKNAIFAGDMMLARLSAVDTICVLKTRMVQMLCLCVISMLGLFAVPNAAQAQNVDWLVNIDDSGFDPSPAGATIEYIVDVDNNGFDAAGAPATTITFDIPATTELTGITGDYTNCTTMSLVGPGSVTCDVPAIASLGQVSGVVSLLTTTPNVVELVASVPTAGDDETGNNVLGEQTTVQAGADIQLTLDVPPNAASGGFVDFDLTALNNGPNDSDSFQIDFPIPAGVTNVTAPGCSVGASVVTCNITGPLANGDSVTRTITGQVFAAGGSTVTGTASVNNAIPNDPISSNNTDTGSITIDPGTDVNINISQTGGGNLLVGDTSTFTISSGYTGGNPQGLEIVTNIPNGSYEITSITSPDGWICAESPVGSGQVSCTLSGGSGAGANIDLGDVIIETNVIGAGSPSVAATISTTTPNETNLGNNTDTVASNIIEPTVDLRANKWGPSPRLAVQGQQYSFFISATNLGSGDYIGPVEMVDNLPAGMEVASYDENGWTCLPAAPVVGPAAITCTIDFDAADPLSENERTPAVRLFTDITGTGTLNNGLTVSAPGGNLTDNNPANDTVNFPLQSEGAADSADVGIIKSRTEASLAVGEIQTFQIEVTNDGPATSTDVRVTDLIQNLINSNAGATGAGYVDDSVFRLGTASAINCSDSANGGTARQLNCTIPSLGVCTAGSDCPVIEVQVRPGGNAGSQSNTAEVESFGTPDPDISTANSESSVSYSVEARADITVLKTVTPDPARAGQDVTFVVTARNVANGLSAAENVTVTDDLPDDMTYVSATPSSGSCSIEPTVGSVTNSSQVVCNVGTLNNGSQSTVTIVARPNNALRGTTITNNASVTMTTIETDVEPNSTSIDVAVQAPVLDILINKDDSIDPVVIGEDTVYTLTVTNAGPSAAENIVVTDDMPTGIFAYRSHVVSGAGTCSVVPAVDSLGEQLVCTFPYLEAGDSETIDITARAVAKGTIPNNVFITSDEIDDGFDTFAANNLTSETTTARTRADMEVTSKIPATNPVNLRESFDFVITVTNNVGAGLFEADNVEVEDTLPSNMELTGTPTATVSNGSMTNNSCTGAAGDTSFTCDFGTVDNGAVIEITTPVKITDVTALPQTFVNTATVSSSSFDPVAPNDMNTGSVSVNSSSLAGTVYRDFNDSATPTVPGQDIPQDTGIAGITITLMGNAFDGTPIMLTTTTDSDGNYMFDFLPQSDGAGYKVTRGTVSEPNLTEGQNSVGSEGGNIVSGGMIDAIVLPSNTAAVDYDFAEIPQARVGIAKQVVGTPSTNSDGSFDTTFSLLVENFSLEPLTSVEVTDALSGAAPLFGTNTTSTSNMADGSYAILSPPSGSCGGNNAGFNGSGDQVAATGFNLAVDGTCTITFELRIQPTVPLPPVLASGGRYENQAVVDAEGALSGQTSTDNPGLTDLSDDGVTTDANGNGDAGEAGENDPTPVIPDFDPSIALVKTADITALSSPPVEGDTITYRFEITNTGNVNLTNVTLTDILPNIVINGGPIPLLEPGAANADSTTFTATYELTQDDVDLGTVTNSATTEGTDPQGTVVDDESGSTTTDDTPLVTPLTPTPSITLIKTADTTGFSDPPTVDDPIIYSFTIQNTGNVTLTNVSLADLLPGMVITGDPIPSLAPQEIDTDTFSGRYELDIDDIIAGEVVNTATVTGTPPTGPNVTDDSGTDATNDTPTVTPVQQAPSITLDKVVDDSATSEGAVVGAELTYTFTVTNTGNIPLNNVTVTDLLPNVVLMGDPIPTMNPGDIDTDTYTATYAITQDDIDASQVINDAQVEGFYGTGNTLSVTAEDEEMAMVGNIQAIPEVFPPFLTDGGTTTSMLASDLLNNQPATLDNVLITVLNEDPGVTLDPTTGLITLAPGNPAGEYQVEYQISSLENPGLTDTTIETVTQAAIPNIMAVKSQVFEDNGDGRDDIGDLLTYTITVHNTGNTPLEDVDIVDTLTDFNGGALTLTTLPLFNSADQGSPVGSLEIGEIATYTATFIANEQAVNSTGVENTVTATALPVFIPGVPGTPSPVTDVSDDDIDSDGNTDDDPTLFRFTPSSTTDGLSLSKTTSSNVVRRGETVPYTITVRNENTFRAGPFNLVDTLPSGFIYVPGSSSIPGEVSTGGKITWPNVEIPANSQLTVTLSARVLSGARAGEHDNVANLVDSATGIPVVPPSTATVRILPEAVFDCGDVIGKVFQDHNGNGYQDSGRTSGVSDQSYAGGKGGKPVVAPAPRAETGIPNVRLATVDGSVITTDANGLFSVPCAMLPADRGSNFILKVDERSLPAGYRVTSENPRVMRLTPGMMTEMNFGASISKVVRVDIGPAAFVQTDSGMALSSRFQAGIAQLLPRIAGDAPNVRLAFHVGAGATSDDVRAARVMMRATERFIKSQWRDVGRTRLFVEQTIVRAGE